MTVGECMTRNPITIDPAAPLETAKAVMQEREVRHLPVVDDRGQLIGIITDRDLRSAILAPAITEFLSEGARRRLKRAAEACENVSVRDFMTWGVVTIGPGSPVAQAAAIMCQRRFGSLPVVDAGRLVGIITEVDVMRALGATLPSVRGEDPGNYFW